MDFVLLSHWNLDPSIVGAIALLGAAYAIELRRQPEPWPPVIAFAAGLATLALALASPLDYVADHVFLLAHMLQHLLLLLVAPALLLVGAPEAILDRVGSLARERLPHWSIHPFAILGFSVAVLWLWHAPTLYEAALSAEPLHALEHLCFIGSALAFWWPILRPTTDPFTLPDPLLIVYLFAAAVGGSMLAALLTFSSNPLYSTYANPASFAASRAALGLTPLVDQQLAGLYMWVVGGVWYFGAAMIVFARWFSESSVAEPAGSPEGAPS